MNKPRTFDKMVGEIAVTALEQLLKGTSFHNIFYQAAMSVVLWADNDRKLLNGGNNGPVR